MKKIILFIIVISISQVLHSQDISSNNIPLSIGSMPADVKLPKIINMSLSQKVSSIEEYVMKSAYERATGRNLITSAEIERKRNAVNLHLGTIYVKGWDGYTKAPYSWWMAAGGNVVYLTSAPKNVTQNVRTGSK